MDVEQAHLQLRLLAEQQLQLRAQLRHRLAWTKATCTRLQLNLEVLRARVDEVTRYSADLSTLHSTLHRSSAIDEHAASCQS